MTEREQQRKIGHRPAVLSHAAEVTGNVSASCWCYGISRPTFNMRLNRYEGHGEDGDVMTGTARCFDDAQPAELTALGGTGLT